MVQVRSIEGVDQEVDIYKDIEGQDLAADGMQWVMDDSTPLSLDKCQDSAFINQNKGNMRKP